MPDSEQSTQDAERTGEGQPDGDEWARRMVLARLELRSLGAELGSGGDRGAVYTKIGCPWNTWGAFPYSVGLACRVSVILSHRFCVLHKIRPDVDTVVREARTDASALGRWLSTSDIFFPCLCLNRDWRGEWGWGGGALCAEDLGWSELPLWILFFQIRTQALWRCCD